MYHMAATHCWKSVFNTGELLKKIPQTRNPCSSRNVESPISSAPHICKWSGWQITMMYPNHLVNSYKSSVACKCNITSPEISWIANCASSNWSVFTLMFWSCLNSCENFALKFHVENQETLIPLTTNTSTISVFIHLSVSWLSLAPYQTKHLWNPQIHSLMD